MILLDIPMPQNCGDCPCAHIFEGYKCMVVNRSFDKYPLENRMDWCPITDEKLEEIDTAEYMDNKLYVRDADESTGHLCNSLNALQGVCFRSSNNTMISIGYYLFRAQTTISYLRDRVKELEENVMRQC